jgi:hypothetical protein
MVDLITTLADPRPNCREHRHRRDSKRLRHQLNGCRDNSRGDPLASGVNNAYGRQARHRKDNWKAICGDNSQGDMRAISDQPIAWHSPHHLWDSGVGGNNDAIAMHLPKCHKITGFDVESLTEARAVGVDVRAVVTASPPQV